MLSISFDFKCKVCSQTDEWYLMPMKEQVASGDFIRSDNKWELVCKKCKQTYILFYGIKSVNITNNNKKKI